MGLWLLGVHGQVVAHIGKDVEVVVPLYVLVVFIRGGLFWITVSRCPSYRQSFPGGVEIPYVAVVLVLGHSFAFYSP